MATGVISGSGYSKNWLEVVIEGVAGEGAKSIVNSFHFFSAPPITVDKSLIDVAFRAQILAVILPILSSTFILTRTRIRFADIPTDAYTDNPTTAAGGVTGDAYSTAIAAYYRLASGVRGRNYNGSKHFGPIAESDVINGQLDDGTGVIPTRFNTLAAQIQSGFATGTDNYSSAVLSRTLSPGLVVPASGITGAYVSTVSVDQTVGTMKHRKSKKVTILT